MRRFPALALSFGITVIAVPGASAQRMPSLSLDASLGLAVNRTDGDFRETTTRGIAGDLMFAARFRPESSNGFIVGVNASVQGSSVTGDLCCKPLMPHFETYGALAGWESPGSSLRAMGGAAYAIGGGRDRSIGLQGRLDAAIPVVRRAAIVCSLRGTFLPNYRGDTFALLGFGVGLRLH